jgi:hypothetical protein
MRCRDNRRAELHYSQLDDLEEHLDKTNTPRSLVTAIIQGITGWYRNPNYQIPLPRHTPISPNTVLRQALTDQNAIGWGRMYSGQISQDFQTVRNVDRPHGSHDRHANTATLSSRYSSTKSKINGNSVMKYSTVVTATNTHSSIAR